MLDKLKAVIEGFGFWIIAIICAISIVLVISLGFYLLGPLMGIILALVAVIAYSVVRVRMTNRR